MCSSSGKSRSGADQHLPVCPLQRGGLPGLQPLLRRAEPAPREAGGHVERSVRRQAVSGRLCTGGTFQLLTAGWKLRLLADLEVASNYLARMRLTICSTIPLHQNWPLIIVVFFQPRRKSSFRGWWDSHDDKRNDGPSCWSLLFRVLSSSRVGKVTPAPFIHHLYLHLCFVWFFHQAAVMGLFLL